MGVKREPVPIRGNAGGWGWRLGGSGLNKAWRQSPHESRCLYLRGGEGGCQRNACDLRVGISPGNFKEAWRKSCWGFCRSWEHRSWGRRIWRASLPPIVLLLPTRSSLAPYCHGDHSHRGYIISRECPKFLSSPGDTHKPAIITLLHDIHTVSLTKFQLILILGSVLVHGPVRSPVYLCGV